MLRAHIRTARVDDAPGVVAVLNPIIAARAFTVIDKQFSEDEEREFIERFPARGILLVAEDPTDDEIVGFQAFEPGPAFTSAFDHVGIIGTYVAENARGRGVASALFRKTFELAITKGYEKAFAYIRADNLAALRAYLANGFSVIGSAKRHAKIDDRYVDEIFLERHFQDG